MMPNPDAMDVTPWLDRLVTQLKEAGAIRTAAVEAAFRRVPRHRLLEFYFRSVDHVLSKVEVDPDKVGEEILEFIYSDTPVVTRLTEYTPELTAEEQGVLRKLGISLSELSEHAESQQPIRLPASSTSQPRLVAGMLEHLELKSGMRVLEIGAGTGYNAALIAELVGDPQLVVSIDIQTDVIEQTSRLLMGLGYGQIKLVMGDGYNGVPEEAPFDRILATVGCPDLSPHWMAQLKPDGFILIPLLFGQWHPLVKIWRSGERMQGKIVANAGFMPMQGVMHQSRYWLLMQGIFPFGTAQTLPSLPGFDLTTLPDFFDFLLILERRTFEHSDPNACGLYDEQRGAIIVRADTGEVLLQGDQSLYDELFQLYQTWLAVGRPQRGDYALEFIPLSEEAPPLAERTWSIERKFYRQLFRLPEQAA